MSLYNFDEIVPRRGSYSAKWTVYPEDHIGRSKGTARAHSGNTPVAPPRWAYSQDDTVMGSNDFRSTKRNIRAASIADSEGNTIGIESDGTQHLRAIVESDHIAVHVNDWFGGTAAVAWGEWSSNYGTGKELKPGDKIKGALMIKLKAGGGNEDH